MADYLYLKTFHIVSANLPLKLCLKLSGNYAMLQIKNQFEII